MGLLRGRDVFDGVAVVGIKTIGAALGLTFGDFVPSMV